MDRGRWDVVQRIFHDALERHGHDRERYLSEASGGDAALLDDVRAMLEHDASGMPMLDAGLTPVAHAALEDDAGANRLLHTSIGPYRLVSILGEGGMGVVYRAERATVGGFAAVKVLRHGWMSPARRDRFAAEQRVLAQLNHPAIAQLYEADVLPDGTPWFAMEYVDGLPLTDYCEAHVESIRGRLDLFRTVCEAVQHAHGHLIVHRDLKPSNIFVRPDGRVKLLDFGISKQLDPDGPIDQTATTFRLMTPAYAAPEQIRGGRTGVHTDVYALGVVLYELLARQRPFDLSQRSPREAESILLETDPVRPSLVAGRLPASRAAWADLNVLCLTAMRKEPERRYPTVDALLRDIDRYLAGQPLDARPDALSYRAGKFLRRHWRSVAATAAVVSLVVSLSVYYAWNLSSARLAAENEAARTGRIQQFMFNLFEGGDPAAGPANDLRVVTLIERGLEQARGLDADPAVQADLFQALGGILQKLGEFTKADAAMRTALERRNALFGEHAVAVAESRIDLGLLKVDQAQLDDAERLVRQGLESVRAAGAGPLLAARATSALGVVLEARGKYDEAITVNEDAVRLFDEAHDTGAGHTAALGQLADSHYYAGHYDVADGINQRVLEANRRLYGPTHPKVADVLINLGASQTDRGRYAEAEPYYRQALAALTAFHGPEHFRTASATTMLARALVYQKRFDEAVPLLQEALVVQERVNGPDHPRVASAVNDLGAAALQQNRFDDAETSFRRMLDIYRKVYRTEHYLHGIATSNLASVFSARKEYARAEPLFREAIGIYERTQSPRHMNTAIGRVKLGRVLLRQGRLREAERELLAGFEILQAQASPSVSWITSARTDLVELYEALKQPADAAKFR
jgi:serine/threonine protein kinase/Tfp pilus assembly protein PilF